MKKDAKLKAEETSHRRQLPDLSVGSEVYVQSHDTKK